MVLFVRFVPSSASERVLRGVYYAIREVDCEADCYRTGEYRRGWGIYDYVCGTDCVKVYVFLSTASRRVCANVRQTHIVDIHMNTNTSDME